MYNKPELHPAVHIYKTLQNVIGEFQVNILDIVSGIIPIAACVKTTYATAKKNMIEYQEGKNIYSREKNINQHKILTAVITVPPTLCDI